MNHTAESLQAAFKYLFPAEVTALKELAQSLPPNPAVVNIGAGAGTSGVAFMETRKDLTLFTIDIQKEDSPLGCLYAERAVYESSDLMVKYRQVQGDSKTVGKYWQTARFIEDTNGAWFECLKIDMVFIDGDHSYNGCKGDILAWLPNIKPGGIMVVHDFDKKTVYKRPGLPEAIPHPLPWPGVDRAVRKFLYPKYEIILHVDTLIAFRVQ